MQYTAGQCAYLQTASIDLNMNVLLIARYRATRSMRSNEINWPQFTCLRMADFQKINVVLK